MIFQFNYLGIQLGGVLSTSQVANNFIGTGFPTAIGGGLLPLSAILTLTKEIKKKEKKWCLGIPVHIRIVFPIVILFIYELLFNISIDHTRKKTNLSRFILPDDNQIIGTKSDFK